jgi:hypothetical protein
VRAVVEVPLQTPALGVTGSDDPRTRGLELEQLRPQLGLQPGVVERETGSRAGGFEQRLLAR